MAFVLSLLGEILPLRCEARPGGPYVRLASGSGVSPAFSLNQNKVFIIRPVNQPRGKALTSRHGRPEPGPQIFQTINKVFPPPPPSCNFAVWFSSSTKGNSAKTERRKNDQHNTSIDEELCVNLLHWEIYS